MATSSRTGVIDILSEMSQQPPDTITDDMTLEQLNIGGHPIGSAEFLDLRDKLEREFNVTIPERITSKDPDELARVKVCEIFELIDTLPSK